MEPETRLFTMALGLEAPWYVEDVAFDAAMKQIDFEVTFKPGSRFTCPPCGAADQPVHDTRRRSWEYPSSVMGRFLSSVFPIDKTITYGLAWVTTRGAFGAETSYIGGPDAPDRWSSHRLFNVFR